jgi:dihydropteroate synthase
MFLKDLNFSANTMTDQIFTLNCKGKLLVAQRPLVMGVINLTPDSFYAKSRFSGMDHIVHQAEQMLIQGADILDIGGQSTRPGADQVTQDEELERVIAPLETLHRRFPEAVFSIDTYRSAVARVAVDAGASMVNDVGGGNLDLDMFKVVATLGVPYVCVHMKGTPQSMQNLSTYTDLEVEIVDFFIAKLSESRKSGIVDFIVDPGFGFSKTRSQNMQLLSSLPIFKILECPVLLGVSRKSTIYHLLGITADEALNGTTVLNTLGLLGGANILRVHDVREAVEVVKLVDAYSKK